MELKDMTAEAVMEVMDQQQPNWWLAWADQRDLQDAAQEGYVGERLQRFLRSRAGNRVMLVMRSVYVLMKKA